MSDLTDRLRKLSPSEAMSDEAADEIDRQRVQCKMLMDDRDMVQKLLSDATMALGRMEVERDALRERVAVLEGAMAIAYGHLWCINDEPGTPARMYDPMEAAYQARQILRNPLTGKQRGDGIDAARAALKGAKP